MSKPPPNFLGLPEEKTTYEISPVVILPVPWEKTTSYRHGTCRGPQAILEASHQVEFYDAEIQKESWKPGLCTLPPLDVSEKGPKEALEILEETVGTLLNNGKFPIVLGGEHTLTAGPVAACSKRYPNLSILQIDAHADLRADYEGTPFSHACAMRLSLPYVKSLVGVGVRSVCTEEVEFVARHPNIRLIYDHERHSNPRWIEEGIHSLTDAVYLTIDVDGFEPNLIPATGTPEPGGLSWYEGLNLLRTLFQRKKVVGADVVELMPLETEHASSFTVAKLIYKLIGYWNQHQK